MKNEKRNLCLLVGQFLLMCFSLCAFGQEAVRIFDGGLATEVEPTQAAVAREYDIDIDLERLSQADNAIEFIFPGDVNRVVAEIESVREMTDQKGVRHLNARGDGYSVDITWNDLGVYGVFQGPRGRRFRLSNYRDTYRLRQVAPSENFGDPIVDTSRTETEGKAHQSDNEKITPKGSPPAHDETRVGVLVLYTPEAKAAEGGGANGMLLLSTNARNRANDAFSNSGLSWLIYSHIGPVEVQPGWGIVDGTDGTPQLEDILDSPQVRALREQWGADMVHLIVEDLAENGTPINGIAYSNYGRVKETPLLYGSTFYRESQAVSVSRYNTAADDLDMAHETGHNLGMAHESDLLDDTDEGWFNDEQKFPSPDPRDEEADSRATFSNTQHVSTVMANAYLPVSGLCSPECTRQEHFSNADIDFVDIIPALATGVEDSAENYRAPFETVYGITHFFPNFVFDTDFGTTDPCPSASSIWDVVEDDNGTLQIFNSAPMGAPPDCKMRVSSVINSTSKSLVRDSFDDVMINTLDEELSMKTRYFIDLSALSSANTQGDEKLKTHNFQCDDELDVEGGCPTVGVAQHKLVGNGTGWKLKFWAREYDPVAETTSKYKREFNLTTDVVELETYIRIANSQYDCTGVASLWINGSRMFIEDEICNASFFAGFNRVSFGGIPTLQWANKNFGKDVIFEDIDIERWGCGPTTTLDLGPAC